MDELCQNIAKCEEGRKQYDKTAEQKRKLEVELGMMEGQKLQLADKIEEVHLIIECANFSCG
jgi:hypothetical protein